MSGRGKGASLLVGLGCAVLLAGAALHLIAAYPQVSAGLRGSNLNTGIQAALRAVFLLIGWDWIAIAMIVLIAAFTATRIRKPLVLICGFLLLLHAALMLAFLGWFVGSDMILASALLILCGALLLDSSGGRVSGRHGLSLGQRHLVALRTRWKRAEISNRLGVGAVYFWGVLQ